MTETLELAVVNAQNSVEIFTKGGLSAVLDEVEKRVRAIPSDVSTLTGRDQIRSVAYKVARTKTALDAEAQKLTAVWRESTKKVNEERKVAQERLDALADEVRAPLTAFENKEKLRVAAHESALTEMESFRSVTTMSAAAYIEARLIEFGAIHANRQWEEFSARADKQRAEILAYLTDRLAERKKFDADQAELERLRKEEIERKAREREEQIRADAAEKARLAAERRAREAAETEARRVLDAANSERARVQAEADRVRAENERAQKAIESARKKEEDARILAEKRAKDAEALRVATELKAADDLKAAKEKAKRDADAAVAKERERVESALRAEAAAKARREADDKHRAKIRADITCDLNAHEGDIINAIFDGKVRHLQVIY